MKCKPVYDSFIIDYNKKAAWFIERNQFDKAKRLLELASHTLQTEKIRNSYITKSLIYHTYGLFYKTQHQSDLAMRYFLKSLAKGKNGQNLLTLPSTHFHLSELYFKSSLYEQALHHGLLALSSCHTADKELFSIYQCIGNAYNKLGNPLEAMRYFRIGCEVSKQLYGGSNVIEEKFGHLYEKVRNMNNIKGKGIIIRKSNEEKVLARSPALMTPSRIVTPPPLFSKKASKNSVLHKYNEI